MTPVDEAAYGALNHKDSTKGKKPILRTESRAVAWAEKNEEKQQAGLKPWEPWADGFKTASTFRAVRRINSIEVVGVAPALSQAPHK